MAAPAQRLPQAPANPHSPRLHAGAFVCWLAIQLVVIALATSRFPFYARFTAADADRSALIGMLFTQILTASLLCPVLLRNPSAALIAIAVAWPMAQLAAFLGDVPPARAALGEAYVSAWICCLMFCMLTARANAPRMLVAMVATLITLLGPLTWYLRAEFVLASALITWPHWAAAGPAMGSISQVIPSQPILSAWCFIGGALALSAIVAAIFRGHSAAETP